LTIGIENPLLQQAVLLHQKGRLAEAASLYAKILGQNPKHADALNLLGVIELQRRNLPLAIAFIDRAIEMNPNNAAFFSNRGVALHDLTRFDEALASYDCALAIRPDNAEVLNNRGTTLRELKRFDEALASYDHALAIHPRYAEALNNRGNVLRDLNRLDEALANYERALAINPDYAEARSNYAQAYNRSGNFLAEQGRLDEAVARYERALAIKPDYAEAHINLGKIRQSQGKLDDAVTHYRRAVAILPRCVEAHLGLCDALLEQGKLGEALPEAEAAALLEEESPFLHFSLGVLFARCNCKEDAREHLLRYLEQDPADNEGARLILAGLGCGPMPERASKAHLRRLYAGRAAGWGGANNVYRGHEMAGAAIHSLCAGATRLDILDAGCGTGLVGTMLRSVARRLDGVDLSPDMLEKAKQSRAYDALYEGDLVEFLAAHPAGYDVIVSAATLIHFGDLKPVFRAAAGSLRGTGLFVFTLFPYDAESGREFAVAPLGGLGEGGCYLHGRDYVARLAKETGFSIALMQADVHEYDKRSNPISGLIVALRRDGS
jgi:predicted TPR repeat methyltransferase